ncbi:helix-turn-helix domain-containing protein [Brevibacillus sp. B_LB10_24]|uniref:helix-turn-helix domain-containing protein n=1 Tax=Brevibacillus sp. B_LB10_24 TaxID=3380645 RepID=UPI0038BB4BD3
MHVLVESIQTISSSADLDLVLHELMERTILLFEGAIAGVIFLYDDKEEALVARSCVGFDYRYLQHVRLKPGESITGTCFQQEKPLLLSGKRQIEQQTASMSPENRYFNQKSTQSLGQINSVICTPMKWQGKAVGVITLDFYAEVDSVARADLEFLQIMANTVAIAIENARTFHRERQRNGILEQLNQRIKEQNNLLTVQFEHHAQLMELLLMERDITEIIRHISTLIGNPVVMYDQRFTHVASSQDETGVETFGFSLSSPPFLSKLKSIYAERIAKRLDPSIDFPIVYPVYIVPIFSSGERLGVLIVVEKQGKLLPESIRFIEQVSLILALDILRKTAIFETEQRLRGEFLSELLTSMDEERMKLRAGLLGINTSQKHQFVILEWDSRPELPDYTSGHTWMRKLLDIFTQLAGEMHLQANVIFRQTYLVILFHYETRENSAQIAKRVKRCLTELQQRIAHQRYNDTFSAGVGRICQQLPELRKSYEDAGKCLEYSRKLAHGSNIVFYDQLGATKLFLKLNDVEILDFAKELFAPLLAYSHQSKKALIETLEKYVETYNYHHTAQQLHIHINTLKYRLGRIQEILEIDFDNEEDRFNTSISLKGLSAIGVSLHQLAENRYYYGEQKQYIV